MRCIQESQFEALVKVLRIREGATREGCRLVFVEGVGVHEASEQTGLDYKCLNQAYGRMRLGYDLVLQAAGVGGGSK